MAWIKMRELRRAEAPVGSNQRKGNAAQAVRVIGPTAGPNDGCINDGGLEKK
jgi:hypothetical protein